MVIRVLSFQIPQFWEAIKFVVDRSSGFGEYDRRSYFTQLLCDLLSNKSQCFIAVDENYEMYALAITEIKINEFSEKKYLVVKNLYSWKFTKEDVWHRHWRTVEKFAKNQGCEYIYFESGNKRIWELSEKFGAKESFRVYRYDVN